MSDPVLSTDDTVHISHKDLLVASDENPTQMSFSQEMAFIGFRRVAFRHSWIQVTKNWPHCCICWLYLLMCWLIPFVLADSCWKYQGDGLTV